MVDIEQILLEHIMTKSEVRDFVDRLKKGEVYFKYMKKNGTLRTAHGTMKPHLIPNIKSKANTEKGLEDRQKKIIKKRHLPSDSIFYYDLDKKGFRSFKATRFEGLIDNKKEDKNEKENK